MTPLVIGLDIGGANLKLATAEGEAVSQPFPLWKYPHQLGESLFNLVVELLRSCGKNQETLRSEQVTLAVTMTGELCDCFTNKQQGVEHILSSVRHFFPNQELKIWAIGHGFLDPTKAMNYPLAVAASNWHALATYLGRFNSSSSILIDIGSTTTDIIPIHQHQPRSIGLNDIDRLHYQELIYTGVRRTPICAFAYPHLTAEWFATSADLYVLLDQLPENEKDLDTPDGRPLTKPFCHARLARMLGGDADLISWKSIIDFAWNLKEYQKKQIIQGLDRLWQRYADPNDVLYVGNYLGNDVGNDDRGSANPPIKNVIVSGAGDWLAREIWQQWCQSHPELQSVTIQEFSQLFGEKVSQAACAFAVAQLYRDRSPQ